MLSDRGGEQPQFFNVMAEPERGSFESDEFEGYRASHLYQRTRMPLCLHLYPHVLAKCSNPRGGEWRPIVGRPIEGERPQV